MWVNVPLMVDDDYITKFATLLKEQLDPSLVVYVEYSNEIWNYGFSQFSWNLNQAIQMVNNGTFRPVFDYDSIPQCCNVF